MVWAPGRSCKRLSYAGIVLVPSSFRTDDFAAIVDAVEQVARDYPGSLAGAVVFLKRSPR